MKLSDYDYNLPAELIADKPPITRGDARLLVLDKKTGEIADKKYSEVTDFLQAGDVLILNDTKVIKARLDTYKDNGAKRELIVLERHSFDDDWLRHRVLYRGKLAVGDILVVNDIKILVEEILGDGVAVVRSDESLLDILDKFGEVPLPPYMHRRADVDDVSRYQTVWAKSSGSVAAPTASLNMTNDILDSLKNKGVKVVYVTLHVGLGTFLPIRSDLIEDHHMHKEYFEISQSTVNAINEAKKSGKRVIALGTTSARALEYAHSEILNSKKAVSGEADIFIYPGYEFKVIDGLLTNYHAPRSTVLMLTASFVGWDRLMVAYSHAIELKYNFLSYGDSMLVL